MKLSSLHIILATIYCVIEDAFKTTLIETQGAIVLTLGVEILSMKKGIIHTVLNMIATGMLIYVMHTRYNMRIL